MANPLILYDNRYDDGTPIATVTESGYSVLYIRDWKAYTFWKGDATDPTYLTVDCGEGTITTTGSNLITNGTFNADTTGWTARACTIASSHPAGGGQDDDYLIITVDDDPAHGDAQDVYQAVSLTVGKAYRISLYAKSGTSGDEEFEIYLNKQGVAIRNTYVGATTAAWVQHTVDFTVEDTVDQFIITKGTATHGTMFFDEVTLYELTNVPMANTLGIQSHNLNTVGATISVECSGDNNDWSVALTGFAPSDDLNIMKSFGTDYYARYWRLKIASHTAAPQIAILCIGEALEIPTPPTTEVDIYEASVSGEGSLSKTGHLLGAIVRNKPVEINYTFKGSDYTYTWVSTDYRTFWEDHASEMKPFFFALDLTNFTDLHWLMRIKPDSSWKVPMIFKTRVEQLELNFEGLWGV